METQKKKRKPMKQGYKILLGVAIGALIGILFGEKATILKPIGTTYLNLMYCSLIPLVFFSIFSSVANLKSPNMLGKMLVSVFGVFITTGTIAALIMITLVNVFSYASGIVVDSFEPATASDAFSLSNQLVNMFTVSDFPELLSRSHIMPLIVFAIIFGVAATTCGESGRAVAKALNAGSDVAFRIIGMLMKIAPSVWALISPTSSLLTAPSCWATTSMASSVTTPRCSCTLSFSTRCMSIGLPAPRG